MTSSSLELRALVADVVRDVIADLVGGTAAASAPAPARAPSPEPASAGVAGTAYVTPPQLRTQVKAVRIDDDADLDRFVRHLLTLFDNPKNRQDLRAGRLKFRLEDGGAASTTATAMLEPAHRIETGAVTERHVKAAAEGGRRLILGRRAVLTPLGREKALALGVSIDKER